jgi:hypothetical protein
LTSNDQLQNRSDADQMTNLSMCMLKLRDIYDRIIIGTFGALWFAISYINIDVGRRELTFTVREWLYFSHNIAGAVLIVVSLLPHAVLNNRAIKIKWIFVLVVIYAESGIVLFVWRAAARFFGLQSSISAGREMFPEEAQALLTQFAIQVVSAVALGVAVALSASHLIARSR